MTESEIIAYRLIEMGLTPEECEQANRLAEAWFAMCKSMCPFPRVVTGAAFIALTLCESTDGLNDKFKKGPVKS